MLDQSGRSKGLKWIWNTNNPQTFTRQIFLFLQSSFFFVSSDDPVLPVFCQSSPCHVLPLPSPVPMNNLLYQWNTPCANKLSYVHYTSISCMTELTPVPVAQAPAPPFHLWEAPTTREKISHQGKSNGSFLHRFFSAICCSSLVSASKNIYNICDSLWASGPMTFWWQDLLWEGSL